jgi:Contractile injection system tube protein
MEKLRIYTFIDRNFRDPGEGIKALTPAFMAPINPETFTKNLKIDLDERRGHGSHGTDLRFKSTVPEELRLEFILDGTQTMEGYGGSDTTLKTMAVHDQLKKFLDSVYAYTGEIHRPKFLLLIWGSEIRFRCILSNLDINHTLFNTSGEPLRIKLSATFLNYKAREERLAAERQQSADLTHQRKTKQGDRLDLMTFRIYNNSGYFLQVGRANGLSNIRNIKPGINLFFPPFDKNES